uniref:Uncharacterized protein n=1 Tax=Acrobeloides nanus TaxID=290746 RepID=A0A914DQR0_9BILA
MIDKELDEQIAYQTRIMNFQQKKIEAIKNIMDQISSATRMKMSYEQIEEIRRNFFNCASIVVQEMTKFDAQNSAQLSYDLSLMSNHRSQKELVVAMVEFLSHLFQLKTPPAESTQHNTLLP